MADLSGDLCAGYYMATSTVHTGRRNLFSLESGGEHHIGTLVSGSLTQLHRFDADCDKIVRGLALLAAEADLTTVLQAMSTLPVNGSWSPAEVEARDLALALIARIERWIIR